MKQKILLKTMLLLCALIVGSSAWGQAPVNTVLWEETWTGGTSETPSAYSFGGTTVYGGASLTYAQSSNNSKLYEEALAGGTSPELLLSKSNQTWTISNIPTGQATEMSLDFLSNKTTFALTSTTTGITISGSQKSWTITATSNVTSFDLTIKNTGSSNARIDNIILKVTTAGGGGDTPTTYTVTYDANGGTGEMTDPYSPYEEGDEVTLLANTFTAPDGKIWSSWLVTDESYNTISVSNNEFIMPASNVTVTAQWADDPNAPQYEWVKTDLADLTSSDIFVIVGNNGSNYALSTANGTSSAPPAYPITIANDKINVDDTPVIDALKFNLSGNATNGYTFYPNGSTTTYIYCTDTNNGVRVGKPNASTTEKHAFTVTDGYLTAGFSTNRYIGIYDSSDWRCYTNTTGNIADQTFTFYKRQQASSVATPTFSVASGTYHESQSVVISCETSGATIYYTTDGNDPTSSSTPYTTAISITETTTLKAIAIKDGESSNVASATYTIKLPLSTIPAIFAEATSIGNNATNVNVTFGNWVVSGVNGSTAYVTDNSGNGFIIYTSGHNFAVNDKLSGTVTGTPLKLFNGSAEFTNLTTSTTGLTVTHDGEITVITNKTIADLGGVNTGAVITLNNLTYDYPNLSDGENTITPYTTLFNGKFETGKTYNVTGVYRQNQDTKQILPRSAEDIEEAPSIAVTPATIAVEDAEEHDGTLDLSYANLTINDMDDFGIQFYDAEGVELATGSEPDWIEVLVAEQDPEVGEGYVVSYYMLENNGEARTAYFKVFATGNEDYVYSNLVTITQAAYVAPPTAGNWVETPLADINANDVFVIVGTVDNDTYALPNNGGTNAPSVVSVTVFDNTLSGEIDNNLKWNVSGNTRDGFTFYPNGTKETWLYCSTTASTSSNNNIKVGTGDRKVFELYGNNLVTKDNYTDRYLSIYVNNGIPQDWRGYVNTDNAPTISFYKQLAAKLNGNGYATFSATVPVDFSKATDFTAWAITEITGTSINFSQITGAVPAGTGVLLKGSESTTVYPNVAATGIAPSTNLLEAITSATEIGNGDYYGLSGNQFVKVNAGIVPAGKALLPASEVPSGARLTFVFEDATGIATIEHSPLTIDRYYDMQGRRVDNPKKGMYIVNGKKVVMK